jgi:hypothetical protein
MTTLPLRRSIKPPRAPRAQRGVEARQANAGSFAQRHASTLRALRSEGLSFAAIAGALEQPRPLHGPRLELDGHGGHVEWCVAGHTRRKRTPYWGGGAASRYDLAPASAMPRFLIATRPALYNFFVSQDFHD